MTNFFTKTFDVNFAPHAQSYMDRMMAARENLWLAARSVKKTNHHIRLWAKNAEKLMACEPDLATEMCLDLFKTTGTLYSQKFQSYNQPDRPLVKIAYKLMNEAPVMA